MRRLYAISLTALLLAAACRSEQRPADVLEPQAMASLLADAYLLEGFYAIETEYRYDTMLPEVLEAYDDLLARHGTTREAVERSLTYYTAHPDQYMPIQDSAVALLARREAAVDPDSLLAIPEIGVISDFDLERRD